MSIYDEWKKNNDSSVYTQWKKKKEEERKQYLTELSNNTNNTISDSQTNNNLKIWKPNESTQSSQLLQTNNNQTNNEKKYNLPVNINKYNNAKDLLKKAEEYTKSDSTENVAQSNYVGNTENTIDNQYKNEKISQDILGIGENLARGASSGLKQTMNYATAVNKGYAGYNNITNQLARAKYLSTPIDQRNEDDLKKNFIEEAVNNSIAKDNEAISKNINAMSNKTTKKLAELAPSIGQMGTGTVIGSVNPILGGEYFFTSAAGSYLDDAKQRGMNDKQSIMYSTVMGGLEAITEEVGLRNFQKAGGAIKALASGTGKEGVKKAIQEVASKEIETSVKDVLKNYGIGITDNFVQEAIMDPLQEISATAIAGKNKADWSNMSQKMIQDGINGGLVAAIVGGANLGVNSCVGIVEKSSNGQTITQVEYNQALQDAQRAGVDVQQNIKEKIGEQINNINSNENIAPIQNSNNIQMEQNIERPKQVIKDFNESARQYNIDYSNEDLKEINQMYNKRGIKAYFDENTFKNNNDAFSVWKPVIDEQGNILSREVVINPNAEDTKTRVQELAVHELGHDLDLNEVQDMILKDASRKENWKSARKSLEDTYREAYKNDGINISEEEFNKIVDEEATMSILQRELGSQEYVNRLVNQNQSIAKKIYNWVIDKLNKFTGGKNEKIFWADVKNKFETAYNQEFNKNDNTTKFSIAGIKSLDNIKNDSYSYNRGVNSYNNAINLAKQNIDNEQIRQKTGWFQDKNGDWKYEFSDKDMALKNVKIQKNKIYKLVDILKHDTLFTLYPEIRDYKVEVSDKIKGNASFDRKNNTITVSSRLIKNNKSLEGTLIHEIQHAIQNIEKFERGTSTKGSKLKYYNSLGEIEAAETKERFLAEKYQNKDMSKIAPESSKANPQHKNLNEYLKNRNLLDKVKDSMYNYFNKKGGNNYEVSEEIVEKSTTQNNSLVDERKRIESENNSGSFNLSHQDNQGRKLTKQQQEYFKNSKVRDENGNLKEVYHGTPYDFNIFKYDKLGENTSSLGAGFYFTDKKQTGEEYARDGGNLKQVYLDIEKPMSYGKTTITKGEYANFIKAVDKETKGNYLLDYDGIQNALMEYDYGGDDIDLVSAVQSSSGLTWEKTFELLRKTTGYDGIISKKGFLNNDETLYVAFNSNQIKNIDNINPTNNPDIRYSKKNNNDWQQFLEDNYQKQGTGKNLKEYNLPTMQDTIKMNNNKEIELLTDEDYSVLNDIYEKEGKTEILTEKKKANILEKYANDKYKFKDSFDILAQKFVNKGHYIDKLSKEANNPELKFIYDKNLNSFAEGQYEIGVAQTNNYGKKIGKSINEIWEPVEKQNLTKEFSEYLLHKHNIDRSERNKYVFGSEIGPAESTAIAMELEKKHPEFKEYAKDIKKFNHNNLECLVDAGLLSNDMVNYLESMYPNYVTISRDLQDSLYAGDKDKTGVNAPLKKATGGNSDIQPLKDTMAQQAIKIKRLVNQNKLGQELAKTLKNAHVEQEGTIELSPTMLFELNTLVDTDTKGNKYYTYFENGELQKLKIDDNLYESLRPTERSRLEETLPIKTLQKVTSMHRSVLTSSNPIFVVTNFFKDFQDGMFNSKYSSKFIKNYGKALNEIVTKGKYYESYMANGGMTNTYFDYNEGMKKKPNKFVEKIRSANEIVEQLPRMSEFISTLEDGKSLNEALYNAAEITTNFKRGGDITKALNRNGVNFLNASVQGLDKQFRNFSGQNGAKGYANLLVKATIMGIVPSILNHILLDDDDDYEKLPESTKDLYYLFKYDDGKFIRIPKGRVLSIFGAAARRTLETIKGQDDSWKGFKDTVVNQIAPNNPIEDNILAPIMQVKNNKTWYGSDLVSSRLQNELPKNQYDETTDEFSKWLGGKINVSPKKINYLIDQYSGGIGDVILPMITPQAKQNVLKDKFTTDSVLKNKYVSKFYDTLEKQTQIVNDPLSTDEDEIQLKYLNNTSKEMGDLYKEKRNIQMSKISNKEKTEKVREIQVKINELAENALQNYNNFSKNQNSAKIGDEEYYKNGKGEWKTLTDEAEQKNDNISTETYADYKQKIYNETQKQRNNGKLNKNQTLKQKDKIQILLNSKYSDKEKKAIYENYIKSEKDTEYKIMSCTNVDIDEYLKYKQQEFESDYKDDGTTTGKVITNSKKKKVYEYVNSSGMTYEQRLLLLGMQYKLNGQERTTLANYVNNLDITSTEKIKIYEKLEGFTVYKNGNIKW